MKLDIVKYEEIGRSMVVLYPDGDGSVATRIR